LIFVIDASVIVKWFVDEARRDKARELLQDGITRFVPDIVFCEVANALRRKIADQEMSVNQASPALEAFRSYLPNIVPFRLFTKRRKPN